MAQHTPEQRTAFERHFQTVIQVVIAAGVIGLAGFAWESQRTFGKLDAQLDGIGRDLSRLSIGIETLSKTAETKSDHDRDMVQVDTQLQDHEQRLRRVEGRQQ